MKLARGALAIAALVVAAAAPQDGWSRAETEHYLLFCQCGPKVLAECQLSMELLFAEYARAFKFTGKLPSKVEVHVHRSRASYEAAGGSPDSVASYDPRTKKLSTYENPELLQYLAHEATHQFFDLAFPGFYSNPEVPVWFSEGLAECFCNCRVEGKKLFINVLDSENAQKNLKVLKEALEKNSLPRLEALLVMGAEDFKKDPRTLYPAAWSFCHFLWTAPEPAKGGGTRAVLFRLVEAFKAGKGRDDAYAEAFVIGGKKMRPVDFEDEWRAFLQKLKTRRPN